MSNFASTFKNEVIRLARKELKQAIGPMRTQLANQRTDIAALKRERDQLKRDIAALARSTRRAEPVANGADTEPLVRFSPARLKAHREKLGLSAEDFGRLADVSSQSVYNWENGKTRPRSAQLQRIAELRGLGKREAKARLTQLREPGRKARKA